MRRERDVGGATAAQSGGAEPSTLRDEARAFWRYPGPRLIGAFLFSALVARGALGRWGWPDLIAAGVVLAAEPFTEWVVHVFVLHARPFRLFGRRIDLFLARKHRAHHADPRDPALVFVPLPVLARLLPGAVVVCWLVAPSLPVAVTAMATSYAMLLTYEWTHHLIHSRYLPRGRYYRYIWRAHRLHHFRNERYWFGVTVHLADHLLRTFPAKEAVPLSATCRTLGVGV